MDCAEGMEAPIESAQPSDQRSLPPLYGASSGEEITGLLKDQVKDLHENLKTVMILWYTWYTFFITLNAGGLAFAHGKGPKELQGVVAATFAVLDLIGCAACWAFGDYATKLATRIVNSRKELWRRAGAPVDEREPSKHGYQETLSTPAIWLSVFGNFLGLVLFDVVWIYVWTRS
jgi:hypothetical protein